MVVQDLCSRGGALPAAYGGVRGGAQPLPFLHQTLAMPPRRTTILSLHHLGTRGQPGDNGTEEEEESRSREGANRRGEDDVFCVL